MDDQKPARIRRRRQQQQNPSSPLQPQIKPWSNNDTIPHARYMVERSPEQGNTAGNRPLIRPENQTPPNWDLKPSKCRSGGEDTHGVFGFWIEVTTTEISPVFGIEIGIRERKGVTETISRRARERKWLRVWINSIRVCGLKTHTQAKHNCVWKVKNQKPSEKPNTWVGIYVLLWLICLRLNDGSCSIDDIDAAASVCLLLMLLLVLV